MITILVFAFILDCIVLLSYLNYRSSRHDILRNKHDPHTDGNSNWVGTPALPLARGLRLSHWPADSGSPIGQLITALPLASWLRSPIVQLALLLVNNLPLAIWLDSVVNYATETTAKRAEKQVLLYLSLAVEHFSNVLRTHHKILRVWSKTRRPLVGRLQ